MKAKKPPARAASTDRTIQVLNLFKRLDPGEREAFMREVHEQRLVAPRA